VRKKEHVTVQYLLLFNSGECANLSFSRSHLFLFFYESGLDFARMRVYIQATKQQALRF